MLDQTPGLFSLDICHRLNLLGMIAANLIIKVLFKVDFPGGEIFELAINRRQ